MPINDLVSKIVLQDGFSRMFDEYDSRLGKAEQRSGGFGAAWGKTAAVLGLAGGATVALASAISEMTDATIAQQKALNNVSFSAAAANREFGVGVGTAQSWAAQVGTLADEFRVFGDSDVANATSRVIDMTKRLGLTEEQMTTLLRRTADLAAGKMDLAGGVERITSAMRGEAESAEYLGLSLNENQVKAYAEAHGLVWSKLTDLEKVQQRYLAFLDQTNAMQGKAAEYADTTAGKIAEQQAATERLAAKGGEGLMTVRRNWEETKTTVTGAIADMLEGIGQLQKNSGAYEQYMNMYSGGMYTVAQAAADASGTIARASASMALWRGEMERTAALVKQGTDPLKTFIQPTVTPEVKTAWAEYLVEVDKAQAKRLDTVDQYNRRLEDMQWEHGRRLIELQQTVEQARVDAAAWGAEQRAEAEAKLASDIAEIDTNLARNRADAAGDLQRTLEGLDRDRSDAGRDYARSVVDLNRETATQRADVERNLAQAIADLAQETEDKRSDILYQAEGDRAKIHSDYAEGLVALEKSTADRRAAINQTFSDQWQDADPFARKMLQYNRAEQLRQLDAEQKAEKTSLTTERDIALATLNDRVTREMEILTREAAEKKAIQEREAKERLDALTRERTERLAALQVRRDDALAAITQREADAEGAYQRELARMDQQAADAKAKLQARYTEELAQIAVQESARVAAAQQQLANEKTSYDDRLAQLEWWQGQEQADITDHLSGPNGLIQTYLDAYAEMEENASVHMQRMADIGGGVTESPTGSPTYHGSPGFQHGADFVVPPGYGNDSFPFRASSGEHVRVEPRGQGGPQVINVYVTAPGGTPVQQARHIGRSVADALRGY